ncbi:MAG: alcohol dehydrogenase catalytic domain-containing protein [Anaerolineae bacterium]|nr:alcohol dehydrogenase catalytic domain-containing protein [Anaerolineae bacterium]
MADKLAEYKRGNTPPKEPNKLWPLYGAGMENLGHDGNPIEVPLPRYGPDELLVRHDACGLCFSDIKIISLGQNHPRIFRDIQKEPIVLGHEVSMTVVGVGENLRNQYKVGDRFIIQADIFKGGIGYAYGYMIQGGLSQYGVIDQRVLNGDEGNYLLPIRPDTGYAESALAEPWACVVAAYGLRYRTGLKAGGTAWIIGTAEGDAKPYTIGAGFDATLAPARLLLTNVPAAFARWLRARAAELNVEVMDVTDVSAPPVKEVDDIVLLGADADLIEKVSPFLATFGILALVADKPLPRKVSVDVGRIHYNRWLYVGSTSPDVAAAYGQAPVRAELKKGGRVWFVGAGGPMGRMHVQRAIQLADSPRTIVCTDVSDLRLDDLCTSFGDEAKSKGIEFICLNPTNKDAYAGEMARFKKTGFDDIVVLAPIPAVIADAATYLGQQGVLNIFAGVGRGTMANLDLSDAYLRSARMIGQSGSAIQDLRLTLRLTEADELSTNRSVAAIGSLNAARDGLQALKDTTYPGKVVIFPHIKEMPLTALADLKERLPGVYAKLKEGREWTVEAEAEFLRLMLED